MSLAGVRATQVLLVVGVLLALVATLVADDLGLTLALGGAAASLLTLAGVVALADRMPPLPPFVVPPRSTFQGALRRSLAGDRLARLQVLEQLDRVLGPRDRPTGRLLQDDRARLLELPRGSFEQFLREQTDLAESGE